MKPANSREKIEGRNAPDAARLVDIRFPVQVSGDPARVRQAIAKTMGCRVDAISDYRVVRKNLDARKRPVLAMWRVEVALEDEVLSPNEPAVADFSAVPEDASAVHIVGAGPAGLYAALSFIQHGLRPVIIERG